MVEPFFLCVRLYVRLLQGIFEGKTLSPEQIRFTSSVIREIGPTEDWYQINCETTFTYTVTK